MENKLDEKFLTTLSLEEISMVNEAKIRKMKAEADKAEWEALKSKQDYYAKVASEGITLDDVKTIVGTTAALAGVVVTGITIYNSLFKDD